MGHPLSACSYDMHVLQSATRATCLQVLNVGIYNAIGADGVYYGFKLGKSVPWVTGFPFNITSHPQYIGSVLTVWGSFCLTLSQHPPGLLLLTAYWTCLYAITLVQEQLT